jgi:hypothetical protein
MQGRNQGLLLALDIAKEKGIEALEEEIKYRNITGISSTLKKSEVEKIIKEMQVHSTKMAIAVALITLLDEFGMGKMQVRKFKETFDAKVEEICSKDGDTTDMLERVKNELGLVITFD